MGCPWRIQQTQLPAWLQTEHALWQHAGVNCGVSIGSEIQWAFHLQYKPKPVKGRVWKRLCEGTAALHLYYIILF